MLYIAAGGTDTVLTDAEIEKLTTALLDKLGRKKRVLILPPDQTRNLSRAGIITSAADNYYREAVSDILPATGTHKSMSAAEIDRMFPGVSVKKFREHNWRGDLLTTGRVPGSFIDETFNFTGAEDLPVKLNRLLPEGGHDLILSVGQVVPHEVAGMANYNKNILIGAGGPEIINQSHYLGAVYGMEKIIGRTDNPVRRLLNHMSDNCVPDLPVVYIQTVVEALDNGETIVRGFFAGDDSECFERAAALSRRVNISYVGKPLKRVVVNLPDEEFKSTWLGNKAVYRSRMAIADGGELIVIAPGVRCFGEDDGIDGLIRKYGYRGTQAITGAVGNNSELQNNLSAAAHLIHGSPEGRFSIAYAAPSMTEAEIESVGYNWYDPETALRKFEPHKKSDGFNTDADGEEFYLIKNAAIGLWVAGDPD